MADLNVHRIPYLRTERSRVSKYTYLTRQLATAVCRESYAKRSGQAVGFQFLHQIGTVDLDGAGRNRQGFRYGLVDLAFPASEFPDCTPGGLDGLFLGSRRSPPSS